MRTIIRGCCWILQSAFARLSLHHLARAIGATVVIGVDVLL